ncbi:MAG: hypothetical protein JO225_02030 [Candidatus Eremiobacteraeota bacterium]|nr:hypothetical protein [Candidatus Eremiobacteraeota bacterium]MBV8642677.1 hypothetical protein [Candidatus Eremiobacteraeota bacterium]
MPFQPIGIDHAIAGIIHVQILRDPAATDPQSAFQAQINAPNFSQTLPLNNNESLSFPVHSGVINATVRAEVDDFTVLPQGATAANATAISCKVVFKIVEFFAITIGSVPVTASLK